jgi:hypothetical protein
MLILPLGHAQAVARRRSLTGRERWMIGAVLGAMAVVAVVLVISIATAGKTSAHGCIYATIPGAVGAQEVNECGGQARSTCQSTTTPGAYTPQAARSIAAECRKAGLPTGR